MTTQPQLSKYGFSRWHDEVLDWCRAHLKHCPYNCAQDGAPNCWGNCIELRCEPSRQIEYYPSPRTELGEKLVTHRRKIVAQQAPLLDFDGVDKELGR